jgi:hypothetical protein
VCSLVYIFTQQSTSGAHASLDIIGRRRFAARRRTQEMSGMPVLSGLASAGLSALTVSTRRVTPREIDIAHMVTA